MKKIIVGMSGATGAIFGIRILEVLKELNIESHLVMSKWAETTIRLETKYSVDEVLKLASVVHGPSNQAASISSGSFRTDGMIIAPCSMKTLAAISAGYADSLIARAADVILKERRKLVIMARETPLNDIHLQNMLNLSRAGALILPPMPAFYNNPETLDDMINHIVARTLDQFDIDNSLTKRWMTQNV
ncbi:MULTISPECIES: UbiX family flavin prenyltransferase [unclassified Paenibacillus]|uniref:UbiX family flavin prenyltransferase n=1 Tax=unclassified Paenibacillus TaxID=185978 RepID=UPI001AE6C535|nr:MULTISPECIES: UbiX family flavin prenyltransferase [unclassified Paenibacillus]MBP1157197.1 4-hydroxy-3-polyprenylbenzoate decarboxylase [Paenibacillus sp. PvP091]MBP1172064.1 4-hydroxy-3-polyprenylbenzoate decarboxylase [Paenibacillus sp. PvR098]MBP2438445.1 4-hydroxy-3-polyprenylbenzoate decarboxylase [Paenibacillus sp. PvP052]